MVPQKTLLSSNTTCVLFFFNSTRFWCIVLILQPLGLISENNPPKKQADDELESSDSGQNLKAVAKTARIRGSYICLRYARLP